MSQTIRAPEILLALATGLDVQNNFAFLPHRRVIPVSAMAAPHGKPKVTFAGAEHWISDVLTFCNAYVAVFTAALGCPIPPMKANSQLVWLASNEGKMAGWTELTGGDARATAVKTAGLGYPTIAAAHSMPHGHIGMMMPSPQKDPKAPYVSAAGATNIMHGKLEKSFGALTASCRFFTHT